MPYECEGSATAKIIADSTYLGSRLISIEVEFPRPYLAEFNTHRQFSRNSASSRAIPVWKRIRMAFDHPYVPNAFGKNKAGMQAGETLSDDDQKQTIANWLVGRDVAAIQSYCLTGGRKDILEASKNHPDALAVCDRLEQEIFPKYPDIVREMKPLSAPLHKQHASRPMELYSYHTVIVTSSDWRNFMGLRVSAQAQPEANDFGIAIARAIMNSTSVILGKDDWHLPYVNNEEIAELGRDMEKLARISSGRCARVSYLTQDGIRSYDADLRLAESLQDSGHMSPFEHVARTNLRRNRRLCGNFSDRYIQFRKTLPNEDDFTKNVTRKDLLAGCRHDEALCQFILDYPEG